MTTVISSEEYARLNAIRIKSDAYFQAHGNHGKQGSSLSAEHAKHPDYAALTNDMRSQIEIYELAQQRPDRFTAYVGPEIEGTSHHALVTWTGERFGTIHLGTGQSKGRFKFDKIFHATAWAFGRTYYGRTQGKGMYVNLKAKKEPATPELPVIFKRHYDRALRQWLVTAFFPTLAWTRYDMTCYAHVGQHGGADIGYFQSGKPCKPEEYADLLAELKGIYEEEPDAFRLKVYRKRTPQMEEARASEYRRASK